MNRREFLSTVAGGFIAVHTVNSVLAAENKRRPNFVFILADDLGWNQLGCYGGSYYKTPNIDRLAKEGMRFTDAYAASPVCSPTRASIMTGKYPARLHLTNYIPGLQNLRKRLREPEWTKFLSTEEVTVAEALKAGGYETACFGKWHLSKGKRPPASLPNNPDKQGFDESMVTYKPRPRQDPEKDAHNVAAITKKSIKFMEAKRDCPFFLYISHNSIHDPLKEKKSLISSYEENPETEKPENHPIIAAMLETLDNSVGLVLQKLKELNLEKSTLVIFFSDNGGLASYSSQTPLRGGKANIYEGGIRVPLICRWPGVIEPNSMENTSVISVDFFPTLVEIAGIEKKYSLDGKSLIPLFKKNNYKLIEKYEKSLLQKENPVELYDLEHDIGERNDLTQTLPGKARDLRERLAAWRKSVNAQLPTINPDYKS